MTTLNSTADERARAVAKLLHDLLVLTDVPLEQYDEYCLRILKLYGLLRDGCEHDWEYAQWQGATINEQCTHCEQTRWRIPK